MRLAVFNCNNEHMCTSLYMLQRLLILMTVFFMSYELPIIM
jgi:hypothetical protein